MLFACAAAVLITGVVATLVVIARVGSGPLAIEQGFWPLLLVAGFLTISSLGLRALRWVFLLRRSGVRIPIRDAYIGYFAGFSLLLVPLLLGEIVVRAYVNRVRCGVPPRTTVLVNLWERLCDVIALAVIAGSAVLFSRVGSARLSWLLAVLALVLVPAARVASTRTWLVAIAASLAAWILPGIGLWLLAGDSTPSMTLVDAQLFYSRSSLLGGVTLAPGGILVTGQQLLRDLQRTGLSEAHAVAAVVAIRLATVGVSTALGGVMLLVHLRTTRVADPSVADLKVRATYGDQSGLYVARSFSSATSRSATAEHFDDIAHAYDVQIPEARRAALVATKTSLMHEVLVTHGAGTRGLDVGCGQGWYVGRMRAFGYDVEGIDTSAGQLQLAARNLGEPGLFRLGSALTVPAADASYDFAYIINVLHHLPSVSDQRAALAEIARVLRPGGLLFVHEINTRNLLFRFYMGYVFPSLNCIDEGVERWLLPRRLDDYTDMPVIDVRYFTFLPDFLPARAVRWLAPLERRLERSALAPYSAHYMAVLRKPARVRRSSREDQASVGG